MKLVLCFWVFIACCGYIGLSYAFDSNGLAARLKKLSEAIDNQYKRNTSFTKIYDEYLKEQKQPLKSLNQSFTCERLLPSSEVPTSVHELRPADVKVIGAVGDSLTTARGADLETVGLLFDFPELSWSIGGGQNLFRDIITLPNILKKYNPNIRGASTGVLRWNLNKAVIDAESKDMIYQAQNLVAAMQEDKNINFQNDWKVITLFIGGNDLCHICDDYDIYSPDIYIQNVQRALDFLHDNVPRAFVNLVEVINADQLKVMGLNPLCRFVHRYFCDCAANPADAAAADKLVEYRQGYQLKVNELVDSERYDTRDDFTVVVQPFYRNTEIPRKADGSIDLSYWASDCFHQNAKGQQTAAKALWNNMVEPVGAKRLTWQAEAPIECPTEDDPYLYTAKNSDDRKSKP